MTSLGKHCDWRSARSVVLALTPACQARLWSAIWYSRHRTIAQRRLQCLRLHGSETWVPLWAGVLQDWPDHGAVETQQVPRGILMCLHVTDLCQWLLAEFGIIYVLSLCYHMKYGTGGYVFGMHCLLVSLPSMYQCVNPCIPDYMTCFMSLVSIDGFSRFHQTLVIWCILGQRWTD